MSAPPVDCDLLVIGGGPAGVSAIRGYRDQGGEGSVALVSAEDVLPYNRPALSKEFLRGGGTADLPVEQPEFYRGVDLRLAATATALDTGARTATLADGTAVRYGSCVLATGSDPRPLPVAGADDPRVFLLRSLASAQRLRAAAADAGTAIVIGSGFIGCEAAVSLARRGLTVTLVSQEPLPQRERLGDSAGRRIAGWLSEEGVRLVPGAAVERIEDGHRVYCEGHEPLAADLVLSGAGITPRTGLAGSAGLRVEAGRIVVDEHMRTGAAGVYAAGDVALATNRAAGRPLAVEHWGDALRMGEVAGRNAAGGNDCWEQAPGFWTQIGDRIVKYAAWGDGYDQAQTVEHGADSFTVWYRRGAEVVGALTYQADDDYERAGRLLSGR